MIIKTRNKYKLMAYWLLTTHGVALFPIGVFIWTWKRRKKTQQPFLCVLNFYIV